MNSQLIDYPRGAIPKSRETEDRPKSKGPKTGYAVERVPTMAALQNEKALRPLGIQDPDESCFEALREVVLMDGKRYRLVRQVVFKGEVPGLLVRTSFDDIIEEDGIDFEKLEARVKRLKSSVKIAGTTKAELAIPASTSKPSNGGSKAISLQKNGSSNPAAMVFTITGRVMKLAPTVAELEWFGGETLLVNREQMVGNWGNLNLGDWFKAVILRLPNGEVTQAILQSKILPPRYLSTAELEDVYSKIKPAELTPMD